MSKEDAASERRDRRFNVRPGAALVEFDHQGSKRTGALCQLSVGGLSVRLESPPEGLDRGTRLPNMAVRIGDCALTGEFTVLYHRPIDDGRSEIGGLFNPDSEESASRLMAVLAGLEVAPGG